MSDKLFEIAFSGQIVKGAEAESVKQKIGQIFKADEKRLAQLFSGRRIIIKREVDEATAAKYRGAFEKAGAVCEVTALSATDAPAHPEATTTATPSSAQAASDSDEAYVSRYPESEQVPQALLSDPLGIRGESIQDLQADMAPVGSQMQHQIKEIPDAVIDTSGMDVAPVGSILTDKKEDAPPPPPDTSGITMADG